MSSKTTKDIIYDECDYCDQELYSIDQWKQHIDTNFSDHIKNIIGKKYFNCINCKQSFNNSVELKVHLNDRSCRKFDIKCKKCNKYFTSIQTLKKHLNKVNCLKQSTITNILFNSKKQCLICGKIFKYQKLLRTHLNKSTCFNDALYQNYKFTYRNKLPKIIFKNIAPIDNKIIEKKEQIRKICSYCNKSFASENGLRKHFRYKTCASKKIFDDIIEFPLEILDNIEFPLDDIEFPLEILDSIEFDDIQIEYDEINIQIINNIFA